MSLPEIKTGWYEAPRAKWDQFHFGRKKIMGQTSSAGKRSQILLSCLCVIFCLSFRCQWQKISSVQRSNYDILFQWLKLFCLQSGHVSKKGKIKDYCPVIVTSLWINRSKPLFILLYYSRQRSKDLIRYIYKFG